MKWNLLRRSALLGSLVLLATLPQTSWSQETEEETAAYGAQLLPAETLLYFSIPDVPGMKEAAGEAMYDEMLADPEFEPFISDVKKAIDVGSSEIEQTLGVTIGDLYAIPAGELTFAVLEPQPDQLGLLMLMNYGDNESAVETLVQKMSDGLVKTADKSVETVGEGDDAVEISVYTMANVEPGNPIKSVCYFQADSYLAIATDVEVLKGLLNRWDGESKDTLAQDASFQYIAEKVAEGDADPIVEWYANPVGITRLGIGLVREQLPQASMALGFMTVLGVDNLKGIGGAGFANLEETQSMSKTFAYIDPPTQGIYGIFQFPPVDLTPPAWVSAAVPNYTSANWDFQKAYKAVGALVDAVQGRGAFEKAVDAAAESEEGPGIHAKKDVIDKLTGRLYVLMGATSVEPGATPKVLVSLGVNDSDAITKLLARTEAAGAVTREFEGATVYEFDAGTSKMALVVAKDHLFFSTDVEMLEEVLRDSRNSLVDAEKFQTLQKLIPAKVSMLQYAEPEAQIKPFYEMLRAGNFENPIPAIDFTKLPEFSAMQKYLKSSIGYSVPDAKGSISVTVSPK